MRYLKSRKVIVAAGVVLGMAAWPLQVSAEENDILQGAGVTSLLTCKLTEEEYIELARAAQGAAWGYTNIGIADVGGGELNVREAPSADADLVGKMPDKAACEVLETEEGWAHIQSGKVEGYVSMDYLLTGPDAKLLAGELAETVALVNADGLNVREEPNVESSILTTVPKGAKLPCLEILEGWVKVSADGREAYVSAEYVTISSGLATALTMTEVLYGVGVSDVRAELVEYAKQFLGNPYVYGGTSLTKGTDCSGFVMRVFEHFNVSLPRTSGSQSNSGTKISESDLLPGDLIFYAGKNGTVNHVALYIGSGQVIHASSPDTGIKISRYQYRTPVKYRRVLEDLED